MNTLFIKLIHIFYIPINSFPKEDKQMMTNHEKEKVSVIKEMKTPSPARWSFTATSRD